MKKIEITCDSCGADLSQESSMPGYRLSLSCEPTPTGCVVYSVLVYPPLDRPHHFCGTGCLKNWASTTL